MKTIKIFLASSDELENDRMAFGNLVRRLDKIYEKRGVRIELFEWEDYDAAFNGVRKQDEYNEHIKESDLFLALFHTRAGKFTIEEFDVATEEFKKHASPKVYTYCRDLEPGEQETPELTEFKRHLFEELGHYWCRYSNRDSMQLHFVMQLQLVESSSSDALKVENGQVTLDGTPVAKMENLPFVAGNEDYVKMQNELQELQEEIAEMRLKQEKKERRLEKRKAQLEENPDDDDSREEYEEAKEEVEEIISKLQKKLNSYSSLKEEFEKHQELLFNTAKRVAQLQSGRITERIRRAIDALEGGKVREANIILAEAERDEANVLEKYRRSNEINEQNRQNVESFIDIKMLRATTIVADASLPIEERVELAERLYAQADDMAQEISLDKKKHDELLREYAYFLSENANYKKAIEIYNRDIALSEELYGHKHPKIATSYKNIGFAYSSLGIYEKALEYYDKAVEISIKEYGFENSLTATSYNHIGFIYSSLKNFSKAIEYTSRALKIRRDLFGDKHPDTATSFNDLGYSYSSLGNSKKALDYYQKALNIRLKIFDDNHPSVANSYNNMGVEYRKLGELEKALVFLNKALVIRLEKLGEEHPYTATTYNCIGDVYKKNKDYNNALVFYNKALAIRQSKLPPNHKNVRETHKCIEETEKLLANEQ